MDNIPIAFNQIININTGAMYLIITVKNPLLTNLYRPSQVISFTMLSIPQIYPIKIHINRPPNGINTLSAIKLIKSKKFLPNILKFSNTGPFAKEQGIPIKKITVDIITVMIFLFTLKVSIINETTTSSKEIEEVKAAKNTNIKNKIPKI